MAHVLRTSRLLKAFSKALVKQKMQEKRNSTDVLRALLLIFFSGFN